MAVVDADDLLLDARSLVPVRHHIMSGRADERGPRQSHDLMIDSRVRRNPRYLVWFSF